MRKIAAFFIFIIISICLISLPVFHVAADPVPLLVPDGLYWDGTTARWNPVDGADSYIFSLLIESTASGKHYNTSGGSQESYLDTTKYISSAIESFQQEQDTIKIQIKVKAQSNSNLDYTSSDYSDYSECLEYKVEGYTKLDTPTGVRWEGTTVRWNPVQNADSYFISCSVIQAGGYERSLSIRTTSYCSIDIESSLYVYAGLNEETDNLINVTCTVQAKSSNKSFLSSEKSAPENYLIYNKETLAPENQIIENQLPAPDGLYWDGTIARWDPNENAEAYSILYSIDTPNESTIWQNMSLYTTDPFYDIKNELKYAITYSNCNDGIFTVRFKVKSISAEASGYTTSPFSVESEAFQYNLSDKTKLNTPTGLTWNGLVATWNPVPNATEYYFTSEIKSNEGFRLAEGCYKQTNSYDFSDHMGFLESPFYSEESVYVTYTVQAITSDMNYSPSYQSSNSPVLEYNHNTHTITYIDNNLHIDAEHFPEETFRRYVSESWVDLNQDGILSTEEINSLTQIGLDAGEAGYALLSLQGIEYFPNLESISIAWSHVTDVDLSRNKKLNFVEMIGNPVETLDVSECPLLLASVLDNPTRSRPFHDERCDAVGNLLIDTRTTVIAGDLVINPSTTSAPTINKAPVAKILTYTGESQQLIEPGTVTGGYLYYSTYNPYLYYSSTIPSAVEVGEYTIYYQAFGDENHHDSEPQSIIAKIMPADSSESDIPIDEAHFPEPSFRRYVSEDHIDSNQDGILSGEERSAITTILHDEESEYRLYSLQGIEYFPNVEHLCCAWDPIAEADLSHNTKLNHVELIDCPIPSLDITECSILLAAVQANPTRSRYEPGSWDQWDEISGCLFVDTRTEIIAGDLIIPPSTTAAATITKVPAGKTLYYTGEPQELVTPGTVENGYLGYGTENAYLPYSSAIPTATEVGEYTVWYRAFGDDDHHHSEPHSVTAKILPASEETKIIAQGSCGDNVTWILRKNGIMEISGTGAISSGFFIPYEHRGSVVTVIINEGVTAIGNYAFTDCNKISQVTIPEGVISIGDCAFRRCSALRTIHLPASLTSIGDFAFVYCRNLSGVISDWEGENAEYLKCYEGDFYTISLPGNIQDIGYGAFIATKIGDYIDHGSPTFTLPEGTTTIEAAAFSEIPATYIAMSPEWDQQVVIGSKAFENCLQLRYFEFKGDGPESLQIANDAFAGCSGNLVFISGFYGDVSMDLEQYAQDHGFGYIENEKYPGDG